MEKLTVRVITEGDNKMEKMTAKKYVLKFKPLIDRS